MNVFPTLTTEQAQKLTANWRNYYASIYNDGNSGPDIDPNGNEVFRGFRIPLEDLEQILETIHQYNAKEQHETKINSIRAYLAKDTEDTTRKDDIHILLVPVVGGRKINPPLHQGETFGSDLLETIDEHSGSTNYQIFNFTTPCPTECDTKSKLYSNP